MTREEMSRRLKTISAEQGSKIVKLLREGHNPASIRLETNATIKQINAVVAWVDKYMGKSA